MSVSVLVDAAAPRAGPASKGTPIVCWNNCGSTKEGAAHTACGGHVTGGDG